MSEKKKPSKLLIKMAKFCGSCPQCKNARKKQKGISYNMVKHFESKICPFCIAYEKVYGRKAHEPSPSQT